MSWIKQEFGSKDAKKLLTITNNSENIFWDKIYDEDDGNTVPDTLIGILNYILHELELNPPILLELLLKSDNNSNTILHRFAFLCPDKSDFSELVLKLSSWIRENYSLTTLRDFILKENSGRENFLFSIFFSVENYSKIGKFTFEGFEQFSRILDYCFELFGYKQLITNILNSKAHDTTLIEYVKNKCVENDLTLKAFNERLEK